MLILISSPSGGGKNTIIRSLMKIYSDSCISVNTTSRKPRQKEKNEKDYFFVSKKDFENKIKESELIEYNFYNGNYYGVERGQLEKKLKKYKIVFLQIDVNGKKSFDKEKIKHISFFLLPESLEVLKDRIKKRGNLNTGQINERLNIAKKEILEAKYYNYKIVNKQGKLEETVKKINEIIKENL